MMRGSWPTYFARATTSDVLTVAVEGFVGESAATGIQPKAAV